jgi:hypothetical protein
MNENLKPNAQLYASQHQLELAEPLGSGKDGIVLVGKRKFKPANVAIKVHGFPESYLREKQAYERLSEADVSAVLGFNVPQLINSDDELCVVEMTIVERPFVLDFAAAYLDRPPEFPDEVWAHWEEEKADQFEERWPKVQEILSSFREIGI